MNKSLYGLKQAPKQWHENFDNALLKNRFLFVEVDKCVYTKCTEKECVTIALYVDDMLIFSTSLSMEHSTKRFLASQFDMKDMGEAKVILGVKITRMGNSIILSQEHYVEKILKRFGHLDAKLVSTPYDANTHLVKNRGDPVGQANYAQIIGNLMHLMNFARSDIAYAVCRLSRYTYNPNNDHWNVLARLMKYLRGNMNYGILYSGFPAMLERFNDANWISYLDEIKSTSSYVFTLGSGVVAWKSSRQTLIATFTMESEFITLEYAGKEA